MNSFSDCEAAFRCAHAHSQASFAGLPGSDGQHFRFSIGLLLLRRHNVVFWFSFDAKENSPRPFPLPANSGLPGSGELRHPSNCGKLLVIHVAQHPPTAGPGWGSHPGGVWGKAPSYPPRPIPVCMILNWERYRCLAQRSRLRRTRTPSPLTSRNRIRASARNRTAYHQGLV